jgi:protein KTI12
MHVLLLHHPDLILESSDSFSASPPLMPLIILTGFPCSGKTERVKELLQKTSKTVLISCDTLGHSKPACHSTSEEEKRCRAAMLAATERALHKDTTVIVDALNYIKGYRYQLYCLAREISTPHLVIQCLISHEQALHRNAQSQTPYERALLNGLIDRYEEPNPQAKWDSPLIVLGPNDGMPFDKISRIIEGEVRKPPSLATQVVNAPACPMDTDHIIQEVCGTLLQSIRSGDACCMLDDQRISLAGWNASRVQRVRKHFSHMCRLNPITDRKVLRRLFVEYIAKYQE